MELAEASVSVRSSSDASYVVDALKRVFGNVRFDMTGDAE
jgi:hypothetical protein